jgi:hypothetical protein
MFKDLVLYGLVMLEVFLVFVVVVEVCVVN